MGAASLFDRTIAALLPVTPRWIVKRVAARYVAGTDLDAAVAAIRRIEAEGACATLDVLGEDIERIEDGAKAETQYLEALDRIRDEGLDSNVSIKLTAFGLRQDIEVTYERVRRVVERAREHGNFVRIDMEDSSTTTTTLGIYRRLRAEGFDNVGVVLQAYMKRSMDDVAELAELRPSYRLCKGIYVESAEIALKDPQLVRDNYLALLRRMLEGGSYVGIAGHDHAVVEGSEQIVRELDLPPTAYEFQMLLGVDTRLGQRLIGAGHRLRIYVPFGGDWYAYSVRRLKENPKIGRYVFLALFKRG
ncbi:MAG: proline dehydrogenase family protein [Planctomycetota bacterium]